MEYNNNCNKRLKLNHFGTTSNQQQGSIFGDYHEKQYRAIANYSKQTYSQQCNKADNINSNQIKVTRKKSYMTTNTYLTGPVDKPLISHLVEKPLFSRILVVYPKEANEAEIRQAFQKFGYIQNISVVRDPAGNQTDAGMASIKYGKASEALKALEEMDGKFLDSSRSKNLRVLVAEDGHKNYKSNDPFTSKLYVKIDKNMNRYDLMNMFKKYGEIENSFIYFDRESKESKGYGTVTFSKSSEAAKALEDCDPCFQAKFSFPAQSPPPLPKPTLMTENESNCDSNNTQVPFSGNMEQIFLQQQQKEKENFLKQFSGLFSQGYDVNNNNYHAQINIPKAEVIHSQPDRTLFKKESVEVNFSTESKTESRAKDQDARVVVRKYLAETEYASPKVTNENLGNDYALKLKTNLTEPFLKSILNLIPGLIVFKTSYSFESINVEYLVKYTNDLNTFYAMQKLNQIAFPSDNFIHAEYLREVEIKLPSDISKPKTDQVLVLVNSEKPLTLDLLNLIFNQFNNVIRCGLNCGQNSGFALFSNEHDATLAVNILDNKEIAMNLFRVHIEKNIENFLFKTAS